MENLTPKEIVEYLDKYVIGQEKAKKTIAVALRNRYRRMKLSPEIQKDIVPKNILMIGDTGVGKTEIARRLASIMSLPFIKVEASKYTEVGFVGRDVESMVRDLAMVSIGIVKEEMTKANEEKIEAYVENKIIEQLLPPLPTGASEEKKSDYERSFAKMQERLAKGELDHLKINVEITQDAFDFGDNAMPMHIIEVQESISKVLGGLNKPKKKEVTVKESRPILAQEATHYLLDEESIKKEALERAQMGGIIFIDEIDKVAVSSVSSRQDPSKEGVQRDLLPIVEGSNVHTKLGVLKTDHILFIAAGAFHLSKPSDLIPELQGRFPLRVELDCLDEETLYRILTEPKNSIVQQYKLLMGIEGVALLFKEEALRAVAKYAFIANEKSEDIGARRLHTIMEKVLEEISFEADRHHGEAIEIDEALVSQQIGEIVKDEDATRYIL